MAKTVDVVVVSRTIIAICSNRRGGEGHHIDDFAFCAEAYATRRGDDRGTRRGRDSLDDLLAWEFRRWLFGSTRTECRQRWPERRIRAYLCDGSSSHRNLGCLTHSQGDCCRREGNQSLGIRTPSQSSRCFSRYWAWVNERRKCRGLRTRKTLSIAPVHTRTSERRPANQTGSRFDPSDPLIILPLHREFR